MSLLESLADPNSSELTDQGVLPCQPALIILHYDADDLSRPDEEGTLDVKKGKVIMKLLFYLYINIWQAEIVVYIKRGTVKNVHTLMA